MYSDTHLHFSMTQERCGTTGSEILEAARRGGAFLLDVGTKCDDLIPRRAAVGKAIAGMDNVTLIARDNPCSVLHLVHYSAGIWPSSEAIKNRKNQLEVLEQNIKSFKVDNEGVIAIGECGLDHHWNPAGEDHRSEADFDDEVLRGERELFEAQLDMARRMELPVIVHSRDAFDGTIECIQNAGYDRGVIHCFSYGVKEVQAFLERGWMIAFGGGVTYTKSSKMEVLKEVIRSVSDDAILVETDAPFLAPEPMRGRPNTPLYIEYTYKFLADIRGVSVKSLCDTVDKNVSRLFKVKCPHEDDTSYAETK